MSQASLNSELEEIHHDKGHLSTFDTSQSPNLETFNQAREKSPIITNGLLFGNIIDKHWRMVDEYSYDEYINDKQNNRLENYKIIRVWTGR